MHPAAFQGAPARDFTFLYSVGLRLKPLADKPNQTKPNQTKPNQTKPNQTSYINIVSKVCCFVSQSLGHCFLHTALPLDYSPLPNFGTTVVLLHAAESAIAFPNPKADEEWGSQSTLCRYRPAAVTQERFGSCPVQQVHLLCDCCSFPGAHGE